jgi:pyruvate formate lyase activating enzyme
MVECGECGGSDAPVADVLSVCADCIRGADDALARQIDEVHAQERARFGLPGRPPDTTDGRDCRLCRNRCRIGEGEAGYCGVRRNRAGRIVGGNPQGAAVSWYHDPLPTNCVGDWVCPGGTGTGYPEWAYRDGPERGYSNLAVFYEACTFDCLFCQNWHYKARQPHRPLRSAAELAAAVRPRTSCICYFGGDPTSQLPHALSASRMARRENADRILRICWETNGSMAPRLLSHIMNLSLASGGCVKFDLKAFDAKLHRALCGVDNARTLENFAAAAERIAERPEPPPLVASTLLVPGYVDAEEVAQIASFIAGLDPSIPYALLAFHGDFLMTDLPTTSTAHAERCLRAARGTGLTRVRLGNVHLLDRRPRG